MNTSITNIIANTENTKVLNLASKLLAWGNRRVKVSFTKKDGSVRTMTCIPNNSWNAMNGIVGLTESGRKMLNTKMWRGIVTVSEILGSGQFQPRSIDLNKVLTMELA